MRVWLQTLLPGRGGIYMIYGVCGSVQKRFHWDLGHAGAGLGHVGLVMSTHSGPGPPWEWRDSTHPRRNKMAGHATQAARDILGGWCLGITIFECGAHDVW